MDVRSPFFQNIACILIGVMFLNPIVSAAADLTVAAGSGASVGQAGNGVPVVNIATPNGSGLSHNKFTDYNVGQQGLILNNATSATQSTQLGGIILGNPNLKNGAANLILNEVTGGSPSQLRGYTEVAGKSARVVVANPHGISCDGCGFINTPRVTLSTGTPIIENGRLDRFDVNGGNIAIEGQGLNATNVDQFDLITRSARINAELHANTLNVVTGRNEVDADNLSATAKADDGSDAPQLAIDSSALGGMYAGAIRLVGTEAGVGVKLAGDMATSAGDIRIDANGQLTMGLTAASNDLSVTAQAVELKGDAYAAGAVSIHSQESLANRKSLAAGNGISLKGVDVVNEGIIEAGIRRDGSKNTGADLIVSGQSVTNKGTQIAARTLDVHASEKLDNRSGTLSGANSRIEAGQIDNQRGRLLADQDMELTAGQFNNQTGLVQSGTSAQIAVTGTVDNSAGDLRAGTQLELAAGALNNNLQGIVAAQDAATVGVGSLDNRTGLISAKQGLALTAGRLDNRDSGLVVSEGALRLNAAELDSSNGGEVSAAGDLHAELGQLTQIGGRLIGGAAVSLDLQGGLLDNSKGLISGKESVLVADAQTINNQAGEISSSGTIELAGGQIDNSKGGRIIAAGTVGISANHFDNSQTGLTSGWQGISLSGGSLDNSAAGTFSSRDGKLSLSLSGAIDNRSEGALVSKGAQEISAGSLDNSNMGIVSSEGDVQLNLTGDLNNQAAGVISTTGALAIDFTTARNQGGRISSGTSLLLKGTALENAAGQVSSAGALTLELTGALLNSGNGQITGGGPLVLSADMIANQGGRLVSEELLNLFAGSFDNSNGGTLGARDALTAQIEGALNNSQDGLIFSQGDNLDIRAGNLNNDGGALQSQSDLSVTTTLGLSNRAGKLITSQGNLEIQADSLDNSSGGLLNSIQGWLQIATTGLFSNSTGTTQAQSLDIEAGQIENSAGHISGLAGDTVITTGSLTNRSGGLYARDSLIVNANGLDNTSGKVGAHLIDFSLAGALINNGGLVESNTQLTLAAASIDNRNGKLRALGQSGNTALTTKNGALDNRSGLVETANTDLSLNVAGLLNDGGTVQHVGIGTLGIASARATQAGGSLITNGLLEINATSWTHNGLVQADRLNLNVGNFTQTSTGRLLATSALTASGGNWVNHGLIASDGTLNLSLNGGYSGNGQLTSLGEMTLKAANLTLGSSSRITGGAATDIAISGLVSNQGRLTSADDFSLRSATLNNHGTLGGAAQVRLVANTLLNDKGLIFSGEDLALRGVNLRNLRGDIYSFGDFSFAASDEGALGQSFSNLSGTVESNGAMTIAARAFENARETLDISSKKLSAQLEYDTCGDCGGTKESSFFYLHEIDRTEATNVSPQAQLLSGKNLKITSGTFDNRYSLVAAGGDIRIDTGTFNNLGAQVGDVTTTRYIHAHRVYMSAVRERREEANAFNERNWIGSPSYNPGNIEAELNSFIDRHVYTISSPSSPTYGNTADYSGIIQATGSVTINATTELNNSVRRPGFAYVSGGNRVDTTQPGSAIATYVTLNPQLPADLQQKQVNPLTLPGFTLPQGEHGLFRLSNQNSQDATASASVDTASPQPLNGLQVVPANGRAAGAHKYLIETNPALTDLKQFMSSDYLLGNLGYDTDATQKRLGDGLYEQRLIREAIVARTGQRYLAGLTSDEAMFRHLMDNAIASKDALGLSLGISLTAEQVAALTHDIVWMEEHEVMGEKVLVPVLYLAQAEGRLASTGALIQGRDVSLISGGNLTSQGTLRASQNLDVTAGTITNGGLMQANERLQLLATDSIRNATGGIIAGRDVSAIALTGDIINERTLTTHEVARGNRYSDRQDFADSGARIEAGNTLLLSAGRDLLNVGSTITAGGNADLSAGRDLIIASQQEQDTMSRRDRRSTTDIQTLTQHASDVKIGGDLTLNADRDLAVIGSRVEAGGDMALDAGEKITLASAANESHFEHHRKGGGKKVDAIRDSVTQQSAELIAGGDFTAVSGGDTTVVASTVSAGDEAYLYAGGELNLLAAQNSEYSLYDKQSKGSFGSKETQRDEVTTVRNIGSTITTGGDLTLVSEGDQRYQKARLESGNDLTLDSGGAITFEAVKDLDQESREKSKSSLAWQSAKGKGTTDETLQQSVLIAKGETVIKAVEGLQIDIKHVDQQTVSQTIDAMVQADPQLAWIKEAEARGDVDWQRVKEIHDSFKYESSGLGAGAQMVMAIVAAAFLGPLMGALASNVAAGTINNGGDLGKGIKFALSEDNLKSYAIAAAAAYVITPQLDQAFGVSTDNVNKITKGFDLGNLSDVVRFSAYSVAQGVAHAGLETAVNGGSFSDNLEVSLIAQAGNVGMAIGFNMIGDWAYGKYPDGSPQKIMAHALFGGLVAEATGSDFRTGALAAGANEALSTTLTSLVGGDENLELMSAQIVGMLAAAAVDGDIFKGTEIAKFATAYNQQVHRQAKQRLERGLAVLHQQGKYPDLDADTVLQDLRKIADGDIKSTKELNPKVVSFLNTEFTPVGLRDQMFEPEDWEVYASIAIDLAFPTPSSKAAAVRRIGEKVSKETLASLEAKYGADLLLQGGAKGAADSAKADVLALQNARQSPAGRNADFLINERAAAAELKSLEGSIKNAHFVSRHGPETTLAQQQLRAKTGMAPDNKPGRAIDASRWSSYQDMSEAIQKAQILHKKTGQTSITVDVGRVIGDGYLKGGVTYAQTTKAVVRFDSSGKPYTAYPKLR
ncbi:DUF637 domain-containing protein [Stutzerimonas urumqiensis]|uniref:two-partner secretion domain-containing protein n=1 Tax=Stutzerimonas urumqiensis TaxID=638269 RepID=UPI003DA3F461